MSTTANIPDPNTLAKLPVSGEILNYAATVEVNNKGVITEKNITRSTRKIETLEDPNYTGSEKIAFKQTISRPVFGTMAGFLDFYPDEDSQLYIVNRGMAVFEDAKARTVLLATNDDDTELTFQSTTGTYDLTADLIETPARRLTEVEKLIASMKKFGLGSDIISAAFASLNTANASNAANATSGQ